MLRILVPDGIEQVGQKRLESAGVEMIDGRRFQNGDLRDALRIADGCIVRSRTQLNAELLETRGRLKVVVRAGVGVDNIDMDAATRMGVAVMNTPNGNTVSAAELTIALVMALARRLIDANYNVKSGRWERAKFIGVQVTNKIIGIIGLGRIGMAVAHRAVGLDMVPIGFDPFLSPERAKRLSIETTDDLSTLLRRCDFLTIHVPRTAKTEGLIGAQELLLLKPTAFVLNVARGGIIDERALADALCTGSIAGAAVDVFTTEPPPADHSLLNAPNIIFTPHLGASTREAQDAVSLEAAELLIQFLVNGDTSAVINRLALRTTGVTSPG